MRLLRGLLVIALCATISACGSSSRSAQSPGQQLVSILNHARAQHSVHYATRSSLGFAATADVARDRGIEHLTLHYGQQRSHLTILLVGRVAYVRGDVGGLGSLALLSRPHASRYAGRWIAIPSGDRRYRVVTDRVTLESFLRGITPQGHGRVTSRLTTIQPWQSRRLSGTKVIEIGRTSNTGGVVVGVPSSGGLPIAAGYVSAGGQGWTMISRWNEPVNVKAPAHAVSILTIPGG